MRALGGMFHVPGPQFGGQGGPCMVIQIAQGISRVTNRAVPYATQSCRRRRARWLERATHAIAGAYPSSAAATSRNAVDRNWPALAKPIKRSRVATIPN